jgi:hypothetical protein
VDRVIAGHGDFARLHVRHVERQAAAAKLCRRQPRAPEIPGRERCRAGGRPERHGGDSFQAIVRYPLGDRADVNRFAAPTEAVESKIRMSTAGHCSMFRECCAWAAETQGKHEYRSQV